MSSSVGMVGGFAPALIVLYRGVKKGAVESAEIRHSDYSQYAYPTLITSQNTAMKLNLLTGSGQNYHGVE